MRTRPLFLIFTLSIATASWAEEEHMSDQADSLDFEGFHKEKTGDDRSIFDYFSGTQTTTLDNTELTVSDKVFVVQQRYTLTSSSKTHYSAFSAIDTLHQQMAKHCPKGWVKNGEWVTPVDGDLQLHYQFRCIL